MGAKKSKLSSKGPPICNTGSNITVYADGYSEVLNKHTSGKPCREYVYSSSGP